MKTIIMDTSNSYLVIGLYQDGVALEKYQEAGNRRQSEDALLRLNELLNKHHWEILDVDEMVITIGPGSYTGQRVALTIAKTLAAISNIKIKAVSSLHGYAGNQKAISVIDARSQKVFVGVYNQNKPVVADQLLDIADFSSFKQNYEDYQVVGDSQLVGYESKPVDLCQNIYDASLSYDYQSNVDNLVPQYLKGVAAKKI
ncbi:tRNA (adenosine(37)-N6)-threonylcarbamoyltransferase complex dimerization subunit type 1 TsaB [uncultured Thomasclavelia sp.]|uniref:tRNA (adenosine(37)-N6)-threonylcarbamoyltransferase complex dimerization subunit type 1 TsaB n=1 Tax=uncultured Thomasclavelia sp. TaxID=3025759 RepID=UPI0025F6F164|nr:tRNA (adenosine(37)-N6)-threonylcarbamoyltransferase complex dimerization subunit type 1 TsaB [uncultured Thomasclavelia sp.]